MTQPRGSRTGPGTTRRPGRPPARASRPPAARGSGRGRSRSGAAGVRGTLVAAGVLAGTGFVLLVLNLLPELQSAHQWLAMAAAFTPYGWLAWAGAVALALLVARGRLRLVAAPLALGLAWHTAVLVPYLPVRTGPAPEASGRVRLLTLNLHFGQGDLDELAATVADADPDLVVLTEVTRANAKAFRAAPWSRWFPYRSGTAGDNPGSGTWDARGTMVLSRHPITEAGATSGTLFSTIAVQVGLPGHPFSLIAAHPASPARGLDHWLSDAEALTRLALDLDEAPLVVAGDLNSTAEHLTLRRLAARAGLRDATAGTGWQPTYPAEEWFPPLIQIDRVLATEEFTAAGSTTFAVAGTDHRGLVVDLVPA